MSTKIYEAYRFPRAKLDEFILLINRICQREVKKRVLGAILHSGEVDKIRRSVFGRKKKRSALYSDKTITTGWAFARAMDMSKKGVNSFFHLDCAVNIWLRGRFVYVTPYVMTGLRLEKSLPKWCEFYGWWDNSDPQDGVTGAAWAARGKVWKDLALDDWDRTRLEHVVLEMKMPTLNGFTALLKMMSKDEKWRDDIYSLASCLYWKQEEAEALEKAKRIMKSKKISRKRVRR